MNFNAGRKTHEYHFPKEIKKGIFALNQKKSQGKWKIIQLNKSKTKKDTIVLTLKDQVVMRLIMNYLENIKHKTINSELHKYICKQLEKKSYEKYHMKYILMVLYLKGKIRLVRRIADKSSFYWFTKIELKKQRKRK